MSTIGNLAKSSIKKSKSKSILIVLTIILTTCLLTSVGMICVNWGLSNIESAKNMFGAHHVVFKSTTADINKKLSNHIEIDSMQVVKTIGISKNKEKNLTFALQYTDVLDNKHISEVNIKEGGFPSKENEILIAEGYMKALGKEEAKIGDVVTITYESRKDGIEKTRDFVVSGIAESPEANIITGDYFGAVSQDYLVKEEFDEGTTFTTYVKYKNESSINEYLAQDISDKIAADFNIPVSSIKVNSNYLKSNKPDPTVIMGGVAIAILIIVSSMIVIYSIFYISIINKVQEYGKIRAIGATKKQIKKLIRREGMLLSSIAVPIGAILGYIIGKLVIKIAISNTDINTSQYDILVLIGAIILSFVTVYISILKPMKIASKISPVEAMRYNGESNSKSKTRDGYLEITVPRLVKANLKRNKSRTVITLVSLCLSGILFIIASTVLKAINIDKMTEHGYEGSKMVVRLSNYSLESPDNPEKELYNIQKNNPITNSIERIKEINGVTDVKIKENTTVKWLEMDDWADFSIISKEDITDDSKVLDGSVDFENENSVILDHTYAGEVYGVGVGDKITIEYDNNGVKEKKELTISAITDNLIGSTFVLPEKTYKNLFKNDTSISARVYIEDNKYDDVKKSIEALVKSEAFLEASYYDVSYKTNEMAVGITKLMAYSLVIIIGIIGFINLINTMITSVVARKKELGMLQAIGLSNKQFTKMIKMEGFFYITVAIGVTLTIGNVLGYIAVIMMRNSGASYATYSYPLLETILLIAVPLIAQILLSYGITRSFNKDSLVDRVRYSE
ncbi:ABC transporter permease [Clostridium sp.]|uniref:ABC transporter permease n=1 Tax=Clostridium sp. TaxID=1506 RepID=UPI003F381E8E